MTKTFKNPANERGKIIRNLLESNKDKFFFVKFQKKDGTMRTMQARLGVQKDLRGGVSGTAEYERYLTVFDTRKQAYRNINVETVSRIKMKGADISVTF